LNFRLAEVTPLARGFHAPEPSRVCTSKLTPPLAFFVDQRNVHPALGDPLADTGTATLPRIIVWMVQR
jgi:hypothetical protein